jgi:hypothetical protein
VAAKALAQPAYNNNRIGNNRAPSRHGRTSDRGRPPARDNPDVRAKVCAAVDNAVNTGATLAVKVALRRAAGRPCRFQGSHAHRNGLVGRTDTRRCANAAPAGGN